MAAAYAALVSLFNNLKLIQNHHRYSFSFENKQIQSLGESVCFLIDFMETYDHHGSSKEAAEVLERQIASAAHAADDVLEYHVVDQIHDRSTLDAKTRFVFLLDLQKVIEDMDFVSRKAKKVKKAPSGVNDELPATSSEPLTFEKNTMVGFDEVMDQLMDMLTDGLGEELHKTLWGRRYLIVLDDIWSVDAWDKIQIFLPNNGNRSRIVHTTRQWNLANIFGTSCLKMNLLNEDESWNLFCEKTFAGQGCPPKLIDIGKTTLARKFFEDPLILDYFECKAWVKVGRNFQLKKIMGRILAQVDSDFDRDEMFREGGEKVAQYLRESLKSKRFLIVLDDIWDTNLLVEIAKLCHLDKDGSRILLTSRLQNVGGRGPKALHVRLLNIDESWDLLRDKVFGEDLCSYQLEKVGRKIAENCEGLPLTIIKVANFLSKYGERTVEYWSEVMLRKDHQVYIDSYKEICEVVFPSYDNLQRHLKACFLYMGVFRLNYEIPQSKLINMWIAEGFLEPYNIQVLENYSKVCLHELVSNSLVMFNQQSSISFLEQAKGIKTCKLHSSVWYLCNREAGNSKFFCALTYRADGLTDDIESQRRLCIHNSILLGIKDVRESMVENCASSARSLLCYGIYQQYQVPICSDFKLLRVLDALTIRMYDFPNEVLELVQLRYLALTFDGEVPASISKLWNLHFLIVSRHLSIKSSEDPSCLPMEIWDMKGLKHLQITGCDLPRPNGAFLCHLETLLNVSFDSCEEGILEAIPNLKKLGVQILALDNVGCSNSSYLNRISHLHKLQTLKCVVVNPEFESNIVQSPLPDFSMLPSSLNKLSLSGFGYPWECMRAIATLPNLQVLKLRCYAFQGPKWEVDDNGFLKLQFLIIEDNDLEEWKVGHGSFPWLCKLGLRDCYSSEEIQWEFESGVFSSIEIVDCNPLAVICLEQIREARLRSRHYVPDICVHSSWMMED